MARKEDKFLDDFLAYLLARASHLVSEDYAIVLKEAGIDRPRWRVLASLSDYDKMTIGELARKVLMKQPTLTKVLDKMEEEKLVKRRHSKEDRRAIKIAITKKGKEKVSKLLIKAKKHEKAILKNYTKEEEKVLKHVLRTFIERL